jgi:thioredoxin-like negative regulator of GroEL
VRIERNVARLITSEGQQRASAELAKGIELVRKGKPAEALPILTLARKRERQLGPAHIFELEALTALWEIRDALALLESAASLFAGNADAVDALAFSARRLGQHNLSQPCHQRAIVRKSRSGAQGM